MIKLYHMEKGGMTLWGSAGIAALAIHAGAFTWMLNEAVMPLDTSPSFAIMVEFAPRTEGPETPIDSATTEHIQQETSFEPIPQPIAEPEQEEKEVQEPEVEAEAEPEFSTAPLPLPQSKPKVAKPKPQKIVRQEAHERPQQEPVKSSVSSLNAADRADTSPISSDHHIPASAASMAQWQSRLMSHLERKKRYPSRARSRAEQGIVHIRFAVDNSGIVSSVSIEKTSGFSELDAEVLALVQRASPVPPPPDFGRTVIVPVRFFLR